MYTDKETIERYMLTAINSSFDDQIDEWIKVASQYIDKLCNRSFTTPGEDAETRVYDGTGKNCIIVDDIADLTDLAISIDGTDLDAEAGDILFYPANKFPKTEIVVKNTYFPLGYQNIEVTAMYGYANEIPELIKWACTVFVAGIINFSNQGDGEVQQESIGRYSVTYSNKQQVRDFQTAKEMLKGYRRYV